MHLTALSAELLTGSELAVLLLPPFLPLAHFFCFFSSERVLEYVPDEVGKEE